MTAPIMPGANVSNAPVRRPSDTGKTGTFWQPGMDRQNPPGGMGPWDSGDAGPVSVVLSGPIYDGRARPLIAAMLEEMTYTVAAQGLADVQFILDRSIQHPTPYYETQVTLQRQANDVVVHDRGIVYGPWLESGRNRRPTRFKGYRAFRRAADELRRKAPDMVRGVAERFAARING